jgi:tRNA nucleotidyltransferase/poly(A) polymerase
MRIKKKNILFEERVKSNMPIPKEIKQIYKIFVKSGFELYVVGGAVRDTLLNKPIKDYDLATDARPEQMVRMFNANNIKNVPVEVGGKQAVVNVHMNDDYEIATFREDSKEGDGRRPDSIRFADIETDVKRRDLTINALFYDIATKEIVDLVGGIDDIKNGVVRTVGDATERFEEDRLRILRAVRFAARVGSKLDPAIDKTLKQNNSLEGISSERIRDEFIKGIKSAKSVKFFLSLLDRYALFDWIFKGVSPINKNFIESNDEILVLSLLLKDVDYSGIAKQLNGLKYSSVEIRPIQFLLSFLQTFSPDNFYTLKKLHNKSNVNDDTFKKFGEALGVDSNIINKFINFRLSITGEYVRNEFGMKDGPELGAKIKELENQLFMNS